jgi:hypothetical protein
VLVGFVVQCVFQKMQTTGPDGVKVVQESGIGTSAMTVFQQGVGGYECVQEFRNQLVNAEEIFCAHPTSAFLRDTP